ncbi:MAG TPA: heavy metal translocating P-type ATPase [Pseudogracilibacillus sp.]|nr:heavy metal translocating P-type ATPase [Pseudogracilibacillus sp.]
MSYSSDKTEDVLQYKQTTLTNYPLVSKLREHHEIIAALVSGAIILIIWLFKSSIEPNHPGWWAGLHIFAFIIGGYAQAKEGITDTIKNKELNVELLMIFAAIGASAIGFWTEGAILIFIFALAGALETYTLNKSNHEISALMDLQPEEATLLINGNSRVVPVEQLKINDQILVLASDRIPADGKIIKGSTSVDESAITGESLPLTKSKADNVFAGTVALDGSITVEITKPASETVFQKIIQMVQTAQDEKSPKQLFIEKFEDTYVKVVLIAVIIMMFLPYLLFDWTLEMSIYRAMVLLVVASPCALVASVMPATLSAISNSAKSNVLFKGGIHLENISGVEVMAFDKTGTLTNGTPVVTDALIHPDYNPNTIHEIVGAIESESTHPLARALTTFTLSTLKQDNFSVNVTQMKTVSGKGVIGTINQEEWFVGKENLAENNSNSFYDSEVTKLASGGKTVVFVSHNNQIVALYALKDTIRNDAVKAIKKLNKRGIKTVMLTGDNELTAQAVAKETGIQDYVAECLPDEKVIEIKKLMKENSKVAMIGDGINDAPALATADLGIAMGEGTDVALETADMVLMKNDLAKINDTIDLSKKMNRIIKQNIYFSITVIALLIISNLVQVIDLPLGVIGHEGSTILVILNGLRLLRY